jgi:hypothetical protein
MWRGLGKSQEVKESQISGLVTGFQAVNRKGNTLVSQSRKPETPTEKGGLRKGRIGYSM